MALPTFTPGTQIRAQEMNDALATLFDMMYPVGSIYMSASLSTAAAVNNSLPGTWQAWGSGRVPVAVDASDSDFNEAGKTGGSKTVTLNVEQIPAHNHKIHLGDGNLVHGGSGQSNANIRHDSDGYAWTNDPYTQNTGGGQAHNNL